LGACTFAAPADGSDTDTRSDMQGAHTRRAWFVARLSLAGAVLSLLALANALSRPLTASAAPGGTLAMNPNNTSINPGDDLSITFDVVGGVNVHRVLLTVTYNPVVVDVVDANSSAAGTQILPGAFPGTTGVGNVLQNDASSGTITYEFTLNSASAQTNGSGTVATAQFHATGTGNANLQWSTIEFTDNGGVNSTPSGSAATLAVGQPVPTNTPTDTPTETPTDTDTPTPTETLTPTETSTGTPSPSATETPTPTDTPAGTSTATGSTTATRTPSQTPAASSTASVTKTAVPTATPRITVIADSNTGNPPRSGVDPAQSNRAQGLPSAGNNGPAIQWWRWMFFLGALMLAGAGWFFTFAIHYGDREPILVDRGDRRRKRRY
jgi:hypothetical protein